jgi:protein-L-isoaspartate(D-aspartate) O-methyltransferase
MAEDGDEARPADQPEREVTALLAELRRQGIRDERVLAAIARVPRHRFVPEELRRDAWLNVALPIGAGQTISQPYVVAVMTEALALAGGERVLEVGTGSGYQAAILAELVGSGEVVSIERHAALARGAAALLADLGYGNVAIHVGDGTGGWPAGAPYDGVLVTASGPRVPAPLLAQLSAAGGRMVIPVGEPEAQYLVAIERRGDETREHRLGPVRFVPLIGRAGWAARMQANGHRGG